MCVFKYLFIYLLEKGGTLAKTLLWDGTCNRYMLLLGRVTYEVIAPGFLSLSECLYPYVGARYSSVVRAFIHSLCDGSSDRPFME